MGITASLTSNPARSRRIAGDLVDAEIREGCTAAASHLPIFVNGPWKTSSEAQAILCTKHEVINGASGTDSVRETPRNKSRGAP